MQLNEGKACDAILRHLEGRQGAARSNLRWPEDENHAAPVELVCNIGDQLFAVEHTAIEPFAGLLQLNNQADQHFRPMEEAVAGGVPHDELYELHLPPRRCKGNARGMSGKFRTRSFLGSSKLLRPFRSAVRTITGNRRRRLTSQTCLSRLNSIDSSP